MLFYVLQSLLQAHSIVTQHPNAAIARAAEPPAVLAALVVVIAHELLGTPPTNFAGGTDLRPRVPLQNLPHCFGVPLLTLVAETPHPPLYTMCVLGQSLNATVRTRSVHAF